MTSNAQIEASMKEAGDRLYKAFQSYHSHNNSYHNSDPDSPNLLSNKIAQPDSNNEKNSKHLLYDPNTVVQTENYEILHSRPQLLAADVDPTLNGHSSLEILAALTDHATKMAKVQQEFDNNKDKAGSQFNGHDSQDLTKAIVEYAKTHDGLPQDYLDSLNDSHGAKSNPLDAGDNSFKVASSSSAGIGSKEAATLGGTVVSSSIFSFATLASSLQWAKIIYGIFWISLGLFLVFFGWASYNWTTKRRSQTGKKISGKNSSSRAILGGGIGGTVVGFLFMSMLSTLIICAVCSSGERKSPSSSAYFAIWLVTGLVGGALGGHVKLAGKVMAGLSAGASSTLILTAMFGIHTLLIRIVLIAVLCPVFTAPLLLPRTTVVQKHLLNACTSIFGILILLDGVALFAPPEKSSSSWLNLWVILFSSDQSPSETSIIEAWGTSSFKGYIAGSVLGAIIGFLFEFFFHKHSGENAEEEWNEYLGTYTERFEKNANGIVRDGGIPGSFDGTRAGLFEPPQNIFAKIGDFFAGIDSSSPRPASYGNLAGGQGVGAFGNRNSTSPLTERSSSKRSRARSNRSKKTTRSAKTKRGTPARFEALGKRDMDLEACEEDSEDEDSDATEYDSDNDIKGGKDKDKDSLVQNYGGYALPVISNGNGLKPPGLLESPAPSYRTSGGENTSSTLSGSTKFSSNGSSSGGESGSQVLKSADVYRDKDATPTSTSTTSGTTTTTNNQDQKIVAATPSLINAISRIQQAQNQARQWQLQQQNSPYETDSKDQEKASKSSK